MQDKTQLRFCMRMGAKRLGDITYDKMYRGFAKQVKDKKADWNRTIKRAEIAKMKEKRDKCD